MLSLSDVSLLPHSRWRWKRAKAEIVQDMQDARVACRDYFETILCTFFGELKITFPGHVTQLEIDASTVRHCTIFLASFEIIFFIVVSSFSPCQFLAANGEVVNNIAVKRSISRSGPFHAVTHSAAPWELSAF